MTERYCNLQVVRQKLFVEGHALSQDHTVLLHVWAPVRLCNSALLQHQLQCVTPSLICTHAATRSRLLCAPDHGHNLWFCSLWQGLPVSTWKRSPAAAAVLARLLPVDSVPEYTPSATVTDHAHKPFRYMYRVQILYWYCPQPVMFSSGTSRLRNHVDKD